MSRESDLELRRSLERYRDFANAAADWFWEMDEHLRFVWISEAIEDHLGHPPTWYYGKSREELLAPDRGGIEWMALNELLQTRRSFREFIYPRTHDAAGTEHWIAISGVPVLSEDGEFEGYRGSARVCTAEVTARLEASQFQKRLRESLDVLGDGYALFDHNDRLVLWNRAYEQVNVSIADLVRSGTRFETLVREAVARGVPRGKRSPEGAVRWRMERHRQAEGAFEHQNVHGQWYLVRERKTADGSTVGIWTDITELKRAQASEREANERSRLLATAIEQLTEIFVLWDEADRLVMCNQPFRDLNARIPEVTCPGTPFSTYVERAVEEGLVPEAVGREAAWIGERMVRHRTPREPFEVMRQDGRYLLIHEEQIGSGTVTLALDITAQKTAEQQTRQAQKLQAVGQLVGGIAHDFNNLLATVLANAELGILAVQGCTDAQTVRALGEVRTAAERGRDVVRQLLTFVRSEQRESVSTECQAVIEETVSLLRATFPAGIELGLKMEPVSAVHFDPVQLQQVMMNLCINARDALRGGGSVNVEVSEAAWAGECASCGQPVSGEFVELQVCDDGPGIAAAIQTQVFDPFFTTKATGEGSGMGLSMVHGIVHRFGGHISMGVSAKGGTCFRILMLPGKSQESPSTPCGPPAQSEARSDRHVMVVDDDRALAEAMGAFLTEVGYRVTIHAGSLAALADLEDSAYSVDLVVTDQTMPELSGLELAKAARAKRPGLPIILCTGYSDEVDERRASDCGIAAYFDKPLRLADLLGRIDSLLLEALEPA